MSILVGSRVSLRDRTTKELVEKAVPQLRLEQDEVRSQQDVTLFISSGFIKEADKPHFGTNHDAVVEFPELGDKRRRWVFTPGERAEDKGQWSFQSSNADDPEKNRAVAQTYKGKYFFGPTQSHLYESEFDPRPIYLKWNDKEYRFLQVHPGPGKNSGVKGEGSFGTVYRYQWDGFGEGEPLMQQVVCKLSADVAEIEGLNILHNYKSDLVAAKLLVKFLVPYEGQDDPDVMRDYASSGLLPGDPRPLYEKNMGGKPQGDYAGPTESPLRMITLMEQADGSLEDIVKKSGDVQKTDNHQKSVLLFCRAMLEDVFKIYKAANVLMIDIKPGNFLYVNALERSRTVEKDGKARLHTFLRVFPCDFGSFMRSWSMRDDHVPDAALTEYLSPADAFLHAGIMHKPFPFSDPNELDSKEGGPFPIFGAMLAALGGSMFRLAAGDLNAVNEKKFRFFKLIRDIDVPSAKAPGQYLRGHGYEMERLQRYICFAMFLRYFCQVCQALTEQGKPVSKPRAAMGATLQLLFNFRHTRPRGTPADPKYGLPSFDAAKELDPAKGAYYEAVGKNWAAFERALKTYLKTPQGAAFQFKTHNEIINLLNTRMPDGRANEYLGTDDTDDGGVRDVTVDDFKWGSAEFFYKGIGDYRFCPTGCLPFTEDEIFRKISEWTEEVTDIAPDFRPEAGKRAATPSKKLAGASSSAAEAAATAGPPRSRRVAPKRTPSAKKPVAEQGDGGDTTESDEDRSAAISLRALGSSPAKKPRAGKDEHQYEDEQDGGARADAPPRQGRLRRQSQGAEPAKLEDEAKDMQDDSYDPEEYLGAKMGALRL